MKTLSSNFPKNLSEGVLGEVLLNTLSKEFGALIFRGLVNMTNKIAVVEKSCVGMRDMFIRIERLKTLRHALNAFTQLAWKPDEVHQQNARDYSTDYGYKVNAAIDTMQDSVEELEAVIDSAISEAMVEADHWYRELQHNVN